MAWRIYLRGKSIYAHMTDRDRALVPVEWLQMVLGLTKHVDAAAAAVYLEELPLPQETWQELAGRMGAVADLTEQEIILLLATVTAESEGDNALVETYIEGGEERVGGAGYGQVWPRWHAERIQDAMEALGRLALHPLLADSEEALLAVLLTDREVSMLTVACLVRDLWRHHVADWDAFTEAYVGPGISDADRARRRAIWERWQV